MFYIDYILPFWNNITSVQNVLLNAHDGAEIVQKFRQFVIKKEDKYVNGRDPIPGNLANRYDNNINDLLTGINTRYIPFSRLNPNNPDYAQQINDFFTNNAADLDAQIAQLHTTSETLKQEVFNEYTTASVNLKTEARKEELNSIWKEFLVSLIFPQVMTKNIFNDINESYKSATQTSHPAATEHLNKIDKFLGNIMDQVKDDNLNPSLSMVGSSYSRINIQDLFNALKINLPPDIEDVIKSKIGNLPKHDPHKSDLHLSNEFKELYPLLTSISGVVFPKNFQDLIDQIKDLNTLREQDAQKYEEWIRALNTQLVILARYNEILNDYIKGTLEPKQVQDIKNALKDKHEREISLIINIYAGQIYALQQEIDRLKEQLRKQKAAGSMTYKSHHTRQDRPPRPQPMKMKEPSKPISNPLYNPQIKYKAPPRPINHPINRLKYIKPLPISHNNNLQQMTYKTSKLPIRSLSTQKMTYQTSKLPIRSPKYQKMTYNTSKPLRYIGYISSKALQFNPSRQADLKFQYSSLKYKKQKSPHISNHYGQIKYNRYKNRLSLSRIVIPKYHSKIEYKKRSSIPPIQYTKKRDIPIKYNKLANQIRLRRS